MRALNAFCTIITSDHLHHALALNESLICYQTTIPFYIFIIDSNKKLKAKEKEFPNLHFLYKEDLCGEGLGKSIFEKYAGNNIDAFRCSMKGVLMSYLIKTIGFQKVIYSNAQIYFFNNYKFLWEELEKNRLFIIPNWRAAIRFKKNTAEFNNLQIGGVYSSAFIGVHQKGFPILNKWSEWCLHKCKKSKHEGIYDDQIYLNLFPIYFNGVRILRHKGCNVTSWNTIECERKKVANEILIEGKYKVIFIHFVRHSFQSILNGEDALLTPHLEKYVKTLIKYKPTFNLYKQYKLPQFKSSSIDKASP